MNNILKKPYIEPRLMVQHIASVQMIAGSGDFSLYKTDSKANTDYDALVRENNGSWDILDE